MAPIVFFCLSLSYLQSLSGTDPIFASDHLVCEFTSKDLNLDSKVLKQLALLGIKRAFNPYLQFDRSGALHNPYKGELHFFIDFHRKTKLFRKWMNLVTLRPDRRIAIQSENSLDHLKNQ